MTPTHMHCRHYKQKPNPTSIYVCVQRYILDKGCDFSPRVNSTGAPSSRLNSTLHKLFRVSPDKQGQPHYQTKGLVATSRSLVAASNLRITLYALQDRVSVLAKPQSFHIIWTHSFTGIMHLDKQIFFCILLN